MASASAAGPFALRNKPLGGAFWSQDGAQDRQEELQERLWESFGSILWPRRRLRSPRGAPGGAKMANLTPRWANMAPKKPPNAAKMEILAPCWKLLGSIFDDLGCFLGVRLHNKKPYKNLVFLTFFAGLGSRMESKSKNIWSRWPS